MCNVLAQLRAPRRRLAPGWQPRRRRRRQTQPAPPRLPLDWRLLQVLLCSLHEILLQHALADRPLLMQVHLPTATELESISSLACCAGPIPGPPGLAGAPGLGIPGAPGANGTAGAPGTPVRPLLAAIFPSSAGVW
jgi:hypothetical protein